jgi:Tol biopolymer transport system component
MSAPVSRAYGPQRIRCPQLAMSTVVALLLSLACREEPAPTEPDFAQGGAATPLTVTPTTLALSLPLASPGVIEARVQFVGLITARVDPGCATVTPASAPATKPRGSSVYLATFTVTPVLEGACTITVTDKKGRQATVDVQVTTAFSGRIAFTSDRDGDDEIYVMDATGVQSRLTTNPALDDEPAFSPDGALIAFSSRRDGEREIYVMKADGTDPLRLTDSPGGNSDPAFSPDGSRIVFGSNRDDGKFELYVTNTDGSGVPTRLTNNETTDGDPVFSPDGSRIAYISNGDDDNFDIYVMNADGSGSPTRLTNNADVDFEPTFSPDGAKIAFHSRRNGNDDIYLMDAVDGGNQVGLTSDGTFAFDARPAFSRDGTKIAFWSNRAGNGAQLYVMNAADGSRVTQITSTIGANTDPAFGP